MIKKIFNGFLVLNFFLFSLLPTRTLAQESLLLPAPGVMVNLTNTFAPVLLKGIKFDLKEPFHFDFIIDSGQNKIKSQDPSFKEESDRLISYFLAALTVPEKNQWVNLSPYEKNRIIPNNLGQTKLGSDMLAQDYLLKQLTASLTYPEKALGKAFWDRIYQKVQALYGTTKVPVNSFNKVWIVADRADILQRGNVAYIVGAHLKVMVEEDYYAMVNHLEESKVPLSHDRTVSTEVIKEIILPEIEKEINTGENFAPLRQIFYSVILASWYKMTLKNSLLAKVYGNRSKVKGDSTAVDTKQVQFIYDRYLQAFKKGVFNYIKQEPDPFTQKTLKRQYFSGGLQLWPAGNPELIIRTHTELKPGDHLTPDGSLFVVGGFMYPINGDGHGTNGSAKSTTVTDPDVRKTLSDFEGLLLWSLKQNAVMPSSINEQKAFADLFQNDFQTWLSKHIHELLSLKPKLLSNLKQNKRYARNLVVELEKEGIYVFMHVLNPGRSTTWHWHGNHKFDALGFAGALEPGAIETRWNTSADQPDRNGNQFVRLQTRSVTPLDVGRLAAIPGDYGPHEIKNTSQEPVILFEVYFEPEPLNSINVPIPLAGTDLYHRSEFPVQNLTALNLGQVAREENWRRLNDQETGQLLQAEAGLIYDVDDSGQTIVFNLADQDHLSNVKSALVNSSASLRVGNHGEIFLDRGTESRVSDTPAAALFSPVNVGNHSTPSPDAAMLAGVKGPIHNHSNNGSGGDQISPYKLVDSADLLNPEKSTVIADGIERTTFFLRDAKQLAQDEQERWEDDIADVVVVGGGPEGLSTALHAAYAGKKVILVESGYIMQTFSDAFMKAVHWMRTAPGGGIGLVQKGQSPKELLAKFDLGDPKILASLRKKGQEARRRVTQITGDQFIGQPAGAEDLERTNVPVARNEAFQHALLIAQEIEQLGGLIVEQNRVTNAARAADGTFLIETNQGLNIRARNIVYAPGFAGESASNEKIAEIFQGPAQDSGRVLRSSQIGDLGIRRRIRSMPAGTTIAVVGTGESAAKTAVEIANINPGVIIHYFARYIRVNPGQAPAALKSPELTHQALWNAELRKLVKSTLVEHGDPITPPTARDLDALEKAGKLVKHLGDYFDEKSGYRLVVGKEAIDVLKDNQPIVAIDGLFISAVGYDRNNNPDPFIAKLSENGLVENDPQGGILIGPDGLSSRKDPNVFIAGAYLDFEQGTVVDASVYGIVARASQIAQQIKGTRSGPITPEQRNEVVASLASEILSQTNLDHGVGRLVFSAVVPGQNEQTIRDLTQEFRDFPVEDIPTLVLAASQIGQTVNKVKSAYQKFSEFKPGLRSFYVLASVQGGQNAESVEKLIPEFSGYPPEIVPGLIIAAVQPGQNVARVKELYAAFKDYPTAAIPTLIQSAVYPLQNVESIKALADELQSVYPDAVLPQLVWSSIQLGHNAQEAQGIYDRIASDPQSQALSDADKGWLLRAALAYFPQEDWQRDPIAPPDPDELQLNLGDDSAPKGGIDLGTAQIQVQFLGQPFNINFDQAEFDRIIQGNFDGMNFQIKTIWPLPSLPLWLGLETSKEEALVASGV